jgi:hypothetical protein
MQFTRIRKITSLFELPNCKKALGKNLFLAMWPLGRPAGAAGAIPDELAAGLAGEGRGKGLLATRVLFGNSVGGERLPVGGAPAASGGGRRGCPTPASLRPGKAMGGKGSSWGS